MFFSTWGQWLKRLAQAVRRKPRRSRRQRLAFQAEKLEDRVTPTSYKTATVITSSVKELVYSSSVTITAKVSAVDSGVGTPLTTQDTPLFGDDQLTPLTLPTGTAREISPEVELPCEGSDNIGNPRRLGFIDGLAGHSFDMAYFVVKSVTAVPFCARVRDVGGPGHRLRILGLLDEIGDAIGRVH